MRSAIEVSVIIPTYNSQQFVTQAIDSVLNQTSNSWELIVVDDGSTDDTVAIIKEAINAVPNAQIISLSINSGLPAVPRNVGLRAARGRFVAFLDSDDYWLPWKLERQVDYLSRHHECELVHGYMWTIRDGSFFPGLMHLSNPLRRRGSYEYVLRNNPVATSSVCARTRTLLHLGGFSEDSKLRIGEDYDLWIKVARESPLAYLSEVQGFHREHALSVSSGANFHSVHEYLDSIHGSRSSQHTPIAWRLVRKIIGMPLAIYFHLVEAPLRRKLQLQCRSF